MRSIARPRRGLRSVGLFAGIGGLELGLSRAGHEPLLLAENSPSASHVLRTRFQDVKLEEDVRDLTQLPKETELLAAGFPCQDLSSVGRKRGLGGTKSRLVGEVFRLLESTPVPWVLLENVPFIKDLDRGQALRLVTTAFDELGYNWAYRVVDAQAFGRPQRRRRWLLVAALEEDPRDVLLADEAVRPSVPQVDGVAMGFYWTEGKRSVGWAVDAVPPIKCGSSVGVASPPAILLPDGRVVTPDVRDAERLQGFPVDWTLPVEQVARPSYRWSLLGNAVSVGVSSWLGRRLRQPVAYNANGDAPWDDGRWPSSAWRMKGGEVHVSNASDLPAWYSRPSLHDFLRFEPKPLSARATRGFLLRAETGSLRFEPAFIAALQAHARRMEALK